MQSRTSNNILGFDASNYQGNIDWNQVKNSDYKFAYVKATEGVTYNDPTFTANVNGAKAAGIPIGAYHFARPDNNSPLDEAKHFVSILQANQKTDLMPVLDLEMAGGQYTTGGTLANWARTFIDYVQQQLGCKVMLYTGNWFVNKYEITGLSDIPLWDSYYSSSAPPDMAGWTAWAVWQYTDTGTVPGISGNVDIDVAVSLDALKGATSMTTVTYDVKDVQIKLNAQGFPCGTADGIMGPHTIGAIKSLQTAHQMPATGTIDQATLDQIDNPSWLRIKTEFNFKPYIDGILVYNGTELTTYVIWTLTRDAGNTCDPQGNGLIIVNGTNVQGIVYQGNTFLPWSTVGIKPIAIDGGGWNFATHDQYFLDIKVDDPIVPILDSLYEKGIIVPDADGNANLNTNVTRNELYNLVYKLLNYLGK